ncbi:MAG: TonB-dependent receptor, partial [Gammaproteobacteria bacterium]|nr:TonB-dependent receptor [Gammaproteobacteria bacterium]MDH3409036.1 TonB-dependent receptor [Gammaproteobacteria bacterium]
PLSRLLLSTIIGAALSVGGLYGSPASAQDIVLEEIIVTAQKREQSLEDVPASVTAITGDTVRDYLGSAENVRALANRVPSLNIESSNGRTQPRFYIRGLGNIDFDNNAAQPVGMVFDEVFLEGNVLRSIPLFDIQRVEVLAGPQGSLFGRNTNAGLVKIDSVRPSMDGDGYVGVSFGERSTLGAEFAKSGQISQNTSARISLKHQRRSNWIDNVAASTQGDDFGEFDETAWRLQFLFEPNDTFTGLLKFHGFNQDGSQPQVFYANAIAQGKSGLRKGFDETVASHDNDVAGMTLDHYGMAANLVWDLDEFTFTSITGIDSIENFQSTDVDGGVLDFNIGALGSSGVFSAATGDGLKDHLQVTQEFRISKDLDDAFFQVGAYILDENADVLSRDFLFNTSDIVRTQTDSFALFGQIEFRASDRFAMTAGARFTADEKRLQFRPGGGSTTDSISVDDSFLSWDLAFTFDINDDWSMYGRFANAARGPVTIGRFGVLSSADTETTDSVEFGVKSTLMDGRARWNTSVYSFTNDDQQLTATGGVGNANRLLNAKRVNGSGIETSLEVLITDNFLLIANASYNDTEIDDSELLDELAGAAPSVTALDPIVDTTRIGAFGFPVTDVSIDGNPLPRSPKFQYNLILQYSIPVSDGEFYAYTDYNHRDESNLFLHETVEFVAEERGLLGLRLGYRSEAGLDVALVGRNITDEITVDGGINFNNLTAFINEPSFWGVELRKDF